MMIMVAATTSGGRRASTLWLATAETQAGGRPIGASANEPNRAFGEGGRRLSQPERQRARELAGRSPAASERLWRWHMHALPVPIAQLPKRAKFFYNKRRVASPQRRPERAHVYDRAPKL